MTLMYQTAMMAAHGISWVVMRVVLAVLFYLVVTPISLVAKWFGKDLLDERIDKTATTYWKKRPARPPRSQYERLF